MALQKMRPIVGHSLLWAAGIAIIIVGIIFYTRQRLEMEKIASAQRFANAIASISYELPGRWQGSISYYSPGPWNRRVLNSEASLLITKSNSQLSGKLVYHGVEEKLSIGFRKGEKDSITIVMQGIDYKRLEGNGGFSLDTFYGIIKSGGLVEGNYRDAAGHSGSWSFKKIETDKQVKTVTNPATFKSDWNKTESPATKPAPEPAPVPQIYVDNITAKDASKASHSK
ncbi:MAG: hypothetical protein NTY86_01750, partial [Deltaproteobacteria bacterium]|nr:hypothetical protein [Deltaproteobacteria bacterium]